MLAWNGGKRSNGFIGQQRSRMRVVKYALLAALAASASPASAAWPERAVTLIVPFAPGGITDILARMTAEHLHVAFKQAFVIENVTGAGGIMATQRVARAQADGYTLYFATVSQIVISPLTQKLDVDPVKAFRPVSVVATSPFIITVPSAFPASTLSEFVAEVRSKPGHYNFASAGVGTLTHLSSAMVLGNAGIEMVHVPYRGVAPAFAALLGGQADMLAASPVEASPYVGSGKLKFLAVTGAQRAKGLADVPTIMEVLRNAAPAVTWNGVLVPTGTPQEIIGALSREIMLAEKTPDFRDRLDKIGVDPVVHTPDAFATLIAQDIVQWRSAIAALGLLVQ
jgi:tripartite-type tricarboxylate transporter receptor subunit TctC